PKFPPLCPPLCMPPECMPPLPRPPPPPPLPQPPPPFASAPPTRQLINTATADHCRIRFTPNIVAPSFAWRTFARLAPSATSLPRLSELSTSRAHASGKSSPATTFGRPLRHN